MKSKTHLYAPLLFGAVLLLTGLSGLIVNLIARLSEDPLLAATVVQLLVYLLPLAFYCQVLSKNPIAELKLNYVAPRRIPFLLIVTLVFLVGVTVLRYLGLFFFDSAFLDTPGSVLLPDSDQNGFLGFLCVILLPAVLEEVMFRSVLLQEYRIYGDAWAIGISSVMFAMVHLSAENFLYYLFMGLVFGVMTAFSNSLVPSVILHVFMNYSYFHLRPSVVEYLRQAGKSPLLPYLLLGCFLLLVVMLFARLEYWYRDRAYDEMLSSRKELLRRELESNREGQEQEQKSYASVFSAAKEIYLSPTFLACVAIFICLLFGMFS